MAITNGYATLVQVKSADVLNITDSNSDTNLELVVEAVSRMIDNKCGRHFYSTALEVRYYTAEDNRWLFVDDIASASGITLQTDDDGDRTYQYTWASTDYDLVSYNNLTDGWPYGLIRVSPLGTYIFPTGNKGVKLTATFGWPAVPKPVTLACMLQSAREYRRFKAILGIAGASPVGQIMMSIPKLDPDVEALLKPYMRLS